MAEQIIRASGSISANIAEGFNRSKKRFVNCLDISIGEANETENWLYKVRDAEFPAPESAVKLVKETIRIEKMLVSLKNKIDASPSAVREIPEIYDS